MTSSVPHPKSDDEHFAFLRSLSALMVRFALDWYRAHPGTTFAQALTERTFFVNLGAWHRGEIYDHPELDGQNRAECESFLEQAETRALSPLEDAEMAILELLPPDAEYFAPRVARDQAELHHPTRGLAARQGCLWTFAEPTALSLPDEPGAPRIMEFHIANHRYPGSFLREPDSVRAEVRALSLRARDLGFEGIGTRSWLNDLPAWLNCFPAVWVQRRTDRDFDAVGGHLGCWGQVITARQTLSHHAENFVRSQGRFEYAMRASWMMVEEALD
jgi:hypothetical protein